MRAGRRWYALAFGLLLLLEALIAVFVHDRFVRPYLGDVLAAVLLYCLARAVGGRAPAWLPAAVFLAAAAVEAAQYFQLGARLHLDTVPVIRVILGSVFDWMDILCYAVGRGCARCGRRRSRGFSRGKQDKSRLREGGRIFPELFVFMACPKSEPPAESNAFSRRFSAAL